MTTKKSSLESVRQILYSLQIKADSQKKKKKKKILVHNMAPSGHPQVKHNLLFIYLEKAIDITTDPLFYNLSLIIYLYNGKCIFTILSCDCGYMPEKYTCT
jgi:hypothetical protein